MIKNTEPISMAESLGYVKKDENSEVDVKRFIKKFIKLTPKDAKEMRKVLEGLELMKMKPEQIVKIIDLMPENSEDLNKIFTDVGLDEDETKKILETVKQFK
ncbi:RNA polymerase Rpb4 [archaeon BMS3Abin17]|nr:RNA polymerase Rpb4 [archaeon BMS3Abin17]HDZ60120.1 hypothetical protein [Candidatus Pacearchaeota archaeon]